MSDHHVTLTVDGTEEELTVEARRLLVHALRDDLGYTAPKVGCESGACGACTVHVDGEAVKSCTVLAVQVDGSDVTTAAGLADGGDLHPVQAAFHEEHGLQCGYCTPGMVMTATDLLADTPDPSRGEIRTALKGNVCRCTGYHNVVDAVESAARKLADGGETATDGGTPTDSGATTDDGDTTTDGETATGDGTATDGDTTTDGGRPVDEAQEGAGD